MGRADLKECRRMTLKNKAGFGLMHSNDQASVCALALHSCFLSHLKRHPFTAYHLQAIFTEVVFVSLLWLFLPFTTETLMYHKSLSSLRFSWDSFAVQNEHTNIRP